MSYKKECAAELGREGERRVAEYLRKNGYIIIKRNYRDRYGEIDIIAEKDNELIFVEVKTRTENARVSGFEAINPQKQMRLYKTAGLFIQRINADYVTRFDAAEVTVCRDDKGGNIWKLKYIKNAF